jgi:outer membrane protein OmpA-like peptidoglycan-associated protein
MRDHDRDAILARRALFISAALAGLGCTTHESASERDPVVEKPVVAPDVAGQPIAGSGDGKRPAWPELIAAAPPLDIPAGLTKQEQQLLEHLADDMRRRYAELETIWTPLPTCKPSAADCAGWASAVQAIATAEDDYGPLCGYSPEVSYTYVERKRAHLAYVNELAALLLADLDALALVLNDEAAWQQQRGELLQARPHPCLSCARPTEFPVLDAVRFAAGQGTIDAAQEHVLDGVIATQTRNGKARLIVRGHADASEADADALARARADAVAKALLGRGLEKGDVEVRSYGTKLPIRRESSELNRRVDFEVEPR